MTQDDHDTANSIAILRPPVARLGPWPTAIERLFLFRRFTAWRGQKLLKGTRTLWFCAQSGLAD
jgi:hypothetical protein